MDFDYSEEQRLLADTLKRFLASHYTLDARAKIVASEAGYSEEVWGAFAEMGLLGLPYGTEYGGLGGSTVDVMVVMEALGEGLVVEPYLSTVGLGGQCIACGGTEAQKQRILPAVVQGQAKLALAQTEVGARYNLSHVTTRARRAGEGWVLDGEKRAVLHGGCADLLVISARTVGSETDPRGISLFLIEQGTPGLALQEYRTIDNLRAADIRLSGAVVPAEALLGPEGEGLALLEAAIDYATALLCGEAVGAIRYAHETTLAYLKTRRQFGVAIGSFQALQHRMVDLLISYEQARSMACLACVKVDTADAAERRRIVSAAKIKIADACRHVSQESVQLHGGMGMTEDLKISHTFRRLTMIAQTFGDIDHHLERFAACG